MASPYTGEGEKIAQTRGEFVQNMNEVGGVTAFGEKSIELIHGSISFLISLYRIGRKIYHGIMDEP